MNLRCAKCGDEFEAPRFRGWCDKCLDGYHRSREEVRAKQNPKPGVIAVGKFTTSEPPESVVDPVTGLQVCFRCGGELMAGYGFAGGYGLGGYNCCNDCYAVQDFREDLEE